MIKHVANDARNTLLYCYKRYDSNINSAPAAAAVTAAAVLEITIIITIIKIIIIIINSAR